MFGPEYYTPGGYVGDGFVLCVSCGQADEAFGREDSGLTPVTEADLQSWGDQCACDGGGLTCYNGGIPQDCAGELVAPAPCECDEGHELTRYGLSCGDTCPDCSEERATELEGAAEAARAVLVSLADRLERCADTERRTTPPSPQRARFLDDAAEIVRRVVRELGEVFPEGEPTEPKDLPPFLSFPSRPVPTTRA